MIRNRSDKCGMKFDIKICKLMHAGKSNRNFEHVMNGSKLLTMKRTCE